MLGHSFANRISPREALNIAAKFQSNQSNSLLGAKGAAADIAPFKENVYIINNPCGGRVLVGVDDRVPEKVLGY